MTQRLVCSTLPAHTPKEKQRWQLCMRDRVVARNACARQSGRMWVDRRALLVPIPAEPQLP